MTCLLPNPNVCVSFIDVFTQKGFQVYGTARVLTDGEDGYAEKHALLQARAGTVLKVLSVIEVMVERTKPILAPSYIFDPAADEQGMIEQALGTYNVVRDPR